MMVLLFSEDDLSIWNQTLDVEPDSETSSKPQLPSKQRNESNFPGI